MVYAASTGELKFQARIGGRGIAPPMTYAIDGHQYIAVITPNPPTVQTFVIDGKPISLPER